MPSGEIRVAALPAHTRARIGDGERTLAAVAARDDRAGRLVEAGDSVFACAFEAGGRPWIGHCIRALIIASDNSAGVASPIGHLVLAEERASWRTRILHALARTVCACDCAGGLRHGTIRNSLLCFSRPAWRGSATV